MRVGTSLRVEGSAYVIRYQSPRFYVRPVCCQDLEFAVDGVWYESATTRPWIEKARLQEALDRLSVLRVMES